MWLVDSIKAKVIIDEIKKQDPEKLGIRLADMIDGILDDSMGPAKSEEIQRTLVPFINKLSMHLTKRLIEDSQKGDTK